MNRQIGWSQESNLLYQISALITRLTQVTAANSGGGMAIGGAITSATEGSILFAGALGVLQQDNANLFWDNTNNRLGIGTNSPQFSLHVKGTFGIIDNVDYVQLNIGSTATRLAALEWNNVQGQFKFQTYNASFPIAFDCSELNFYTFFTQKAKLFGSGNFGLQNGGTFNDSGERLQVTGTAKITGDVSIGGVLRPTVTTNRQTASYTLAIADRGKLVEMNVATANNLTIPLDSSVAFPIGTEIEIVQYGAGQTTIVATGGVTIRSASGNLKIASQYVAISLIKIGTNEWYCFGNLSA